MIDSPNPEENKTSDAEMFFAQFQEGAPAKTESKADPEFDVQMEKRIAEPVKQPTFKEAFAAARKDPEAIKSGKFYYEDPTGKHSGWKSLALASDKPAAKPAMKDMPPVTKPPELTKGALKESSPHSMKSDTDIYADNFIQDGINKIKSKLNEKGSAQKTLPSGKPNLTAAV